MNKIVKKKRMIMIVTLIMAIITICFFYKMLFKKSALNDDYKNKLYDLRGEISDEDRSKIIAELEGLYIEDDEYACFNRDKVEYDREFYNEAAVVREAYRLGDVYTLDAYRRYHQTFNLTNSGVEFLVCQIIGIKYAGMSDYNSDEELLSFFLDESVRLNYTVDYRDMIDLIDTFGYDLMASKFDMQEYYEDIIGDCNFDSEMLFKEDGSFKDFDSSTAVSLRFLKKMHLSDRLDMDRVNNWLYHNKAMIDEFISDHAPDHYDDSFITFAWAYYEYTGDISLLEIEDERYYTYLMSEFQEYETNLYNAFGVRNSEEFLNEHPDFIEKEIESMHEYADMYDYSIESMRGDAYYGLYRVLVLADACGFEYDKDKIKALVKKEIRDDSAPDMATVYEIVRLAYVLGIVDEIPDEYTHDIDMSYDDIDLDKSFYQVISICYQIKLLTDPDFKVSSDVKNRLVSRLNDVDAIEAHHIDYYIPLRIILGIKTDPISKDKLKEYADAYDSELDKLYYKYVIDGMN